MRDDRYVLTRAERREALAAWRKVPSAARLESVRRAKRGLPIADAPVSAAALAYARYLLQRNWSNRLPRSLLAVAGALLTVVGVLLWSGVVTVVGEAATGLGVFTTTGGVIVMLMGLLSWSQREGAALLLAANPVDPADLGVPGRSGAAGSAQGRVCDPRAVEVERRPEAAP